MITWIKCLLLIVVAVVAGVHSLQFWTIGCSVLEVLFFFYFTNLVLKSYQRIGYVVNCILSLVFVFQAAILFFSGEYLSLLMIDNLDMIGNLGDVLPKVIVGAFFLILISILSIRYVHVSLLSKKIIPLFFILYISLSLFIFFSSHVLYSPCMMFVKTGVGFVVAKNKQSKYIVSEEQKAIYLKEFYKDSIEMSNTSLRLKLPQKPNIILLFAEGFSAEMMDVVNNQGLGLTPNLNEFYKKALVVDNYYNHTAATFRGIRGQFYSSFQYLNGIEKKINSTVDVDPDLIRKRSNTKLISLIDILKESGYTTSFVNVEPRNKTVVTYFESFKFDHIYSDLRNDDKYISDKEAFLLTADIVENSKSPFFICMYNLGTHFGFDSPDYKYKDGSNPLLNRIYNYDIAFGEFVDFLKKKQVFDNTVLVFTTDHAAYNAIDLGKAFDNVSGYFVDRIPLMIYWNGVEHSVIDADGRNSLDFAPTILDLLAINHENYFLGESLFLDKKNIYNTHSAIADYFFTTQNNKVEYLDNLDEEIFKQIQKNYVISLNLSK